MTSLLPDLLVSSIQSGLVLLRDSVESDGSFFCSCLLR